MGIVQKDALRTMLISYLGLALGYLNKGLLFLILLNTEQIGLVNLIVSVGMLFAQLANFGTLYTTLKFWPYLNNKDKNHFGFLPFILLIVFIGILFFTAVFVFFKPQVGSYYIEKSKLFVSYYYWVIPIGICQVLFNVIEVYLRSFLKNIVAVIAQEIILRLCVLILLILFGFNWIPFSSFVLLNSLIYAVPTIILFVYLKMIGEFNLRFSDIQIPKRFKKLLVQFSVYNYFNTLATQLVLTLDVLMVGQLLGLKQVGVYSIMVFLTSALQVPYKSIIRISSSLVSYHWKHREIDKLRKLYQNVSSVSLFFGLFSFLLVWINVDFLFSFLNKDYSEGKWVLLFLMIGKIIDMYSGLNGSIFMTSKKYKYDIYFSFLLVVLVYFLNLLFIPSLGVAGAAISTSIALIIYNVCRLVFVYVFFKLHPFQVNQFKLIIWFCVCFCIGYFINHLLPNKYLQFLVQSFFISVLFLVPVYIFNWEPNSKDYLLKVKKIIFK